MPILAVSSHVAVGHVGNAAAVPALERLGHPVWRVDTVSFSNHPGHGHHTGTVRPEPEIRDLLKGIGQHTGWRGCAGIYSGYLGEAAGAQAIAGAVDAARAVEPDLIYVCDPVIGDNGRVFVREGVEKALRDRLVPRANAITPNAFELQRLSGHRVVACRTPRPPRSRSWSGGRTSWSVPGFRTATIWRSCWSRSRPTT
ncbi:MAG: pyridoxal kinase [Thalassobaculum sp.]|uniref:pyridoxal kinase n=1 Tax=Thalassobaculum sp. TaxID=2022740 RepID=UPI0032EBE8B9